MNIKRSHFRSFSGKKGDALVEFILIIPLISIFLFCSWEFFKVTSMRISLIKAVRYLVWEKADYTGGTGGSDPVPSANAIAGVKSLYELPDTVSLNLNNTTTSSFGGLDEILSLSFTGLGLDFAGLWSASAETDFPIEFSNRINRFFPGENDVPTSIHLKETGMLQTDSWNATTPDTQVKDRLSGYWLVGPMDFSGGEVTGFITDILNFEINIWPFDSVKICREQPPRVNLNSVPDRFE